MDNRVFNVNGKGLDMLKRVLALAFEQSNSKQCPAYEVTNKGLTLLWHKTDKSTQFPAPLDPEQTALVVWGWLQSDEAKKVKLSGWDADQDHDGHNGTGWRVFCEGWGHVGNNHYAIAAVTPAFMWYGK